MELPNFSKRLIKLSDHQKQELHKNDKNYDFDEDDEISDHFYEQNVINNSCLNDILVSIDKLNEKMTTNNNVIFEKISSLENKINNLNSELEETLLIVLDLQTKKN